MLTAITAASLTLGSLGVHAEARSIAASAGRTVLGGDEHCFNVASLGGIIRNDCGRTAWYEIALPADGSWPDEVYDITVTARGEDTDSNVGCGAHGLYRDSDGIMWWTSSSPGVRYLDAFRTAREIRFSVYVPPGGALIVDCDVHPGGMITHVNFG